MPERVDIQMIGGLWDQRNLSPLDIIVSFQAHEIRTEHPYERLFNEGSPEGLAGD